MSNPAEHRKSLAEEIIALQNTFKSDIMAKQIEALKSESMLETARLLNDGLRKVNPDIGADDSANIWLRPYAKTQTRKTVAKNSVWFTAYMPSVLGGIKPLQTLANPALWKTFRKLHIDALHTGPVMTSGGYATMADADRSTSLPDGKASRYPTMDGWFDPIKIEIDNDLGTKEDYLNLVDAAKKSDPERGAIVIGDIVPGHTGLGPDFYLALKGVSPYTGLYMLIRIDDILEDSDNPKYHSLENEIREKLSDVTVSSRLLEEGEVNHLREKEIIPGRLEREMGVQGGKGWSVTGPVEGVTADGSRTTRRWLYLHFFHPKQPTLNWADPSYASWRLVTGELNYIVATLKSQGVRLDANAFLGVEISEDGTEEINQAQASTAKAERDTWSEAHPLSEMATQMLAWQARRLGGFSFQENNMRLPSIATSAKYGPDLSYDFISRPACQHALLTGNTNLLHFMYSEMKRAAIDPMSLIHALQNHDEFTYELVHLASLAGEPAKFDSAPFFERTEPLFRPQNKDDHTWDENERKALLPQDGAEITTRKPASSTWGDIKTEMRDRAIAGNDYNRESGNGLCTTMVGLVAASLGIPARTEIFAAKEKIQSGHLLLAGFNALQPGVFALSGWDLVGALPLTEDKLSPEPLNTGKPKPKASEKDYRWINRGAYKLLDTFSDEALRFTGSGNELKSLPPADALYGPIDLQQNDPYSFVRQLQRLLTVREKQEIATADFWGTLELEAQTRDEHVNRKLFAMLMGPSHGSTKHGLMAIFNFSQECVVVSSETFARIPDRRLTWRAEWEATSKSAATALLKEGQWLLVYDSISETLNDRPATEEQNSLQPWQFQLYTLSGKQDVSNGAA